MFLELTEFCRTLLSKRPSVALATWTTRVALRSFVTRLGPALRKERADAILSSLRSANLDSQSFEERLLRCMARRDPERRCLLVYDVETLAPAAGRVVNGYRERLAAFRAVVIVIRENRKRDLVLACPDLMAWVGTNVLRVEDVTPPFTLRQVAAAIRCLEKRFNMPSKVFREKWVRGEIEATDDLWAWNELIDMRTSIQAEEE